MTPGTMVKGVKRLTADWPYDVISMGYPGLVLHGRIAAEPRNLGHGWIGYDFAEAFGHPVTLLMIDPPLASFSASFLRSPRRRQSRAVHVARAFLAAAVYVDIYLLTGCVGRLPRRIACSARASSLLADSPSPDPWPSAEA